MADLKDIQILELKDTISQLNNTIRNQNDLIESLKQMLEDRNNKDDEKDRMIANLQAQLDFLKQKLFGSTSEVHKGQVEGQLSIFDNQEDDEKPAIPVEPEYIEVKSYTKKRKSKATYDEIFENLPTRKVYVDTLTDDQKVCGICGTQMVPIGHELIRTEIIYHQPKLERVQYMATTYECPKCKDTEEPQFIKDEGLPALIAGSYASAELVAYVIYAKYVLGLPLYRLEQDFEHLGAKISRTTMANWIIRCSQDYFMPLNDYLHRCLLKRRYLMADETPIQVLKEPNRRPQSKSYVWLMRTGEDGEVPIIIYNYTPTRAGYNAAKFLKDAQPGFYLMVDGYQGYNKVASANRCCCYTHIRRYFVRAITKGHEKDFMDPGVQGVMYCDKLFEYERSYREKGLSFKQIYNRRLKDEKPVIEAFLAWVDHLKPNASNESLKKAIKYVKNCAPYMMNYLKDGHCSLSNNLSENSIRPLVIGRKNFLFSDTQDGANASMMAYSIIETAKANGLDPLKYIQYLLNKRPSSNMVDEELERLMPWCDEVVDQINSKN
ncbi:MAG: IS66 family transposase [Lachnospiraceae bacterium]|nr:IS66 family transposase [Lachnospiraceae bacterium]